MRFSKNSQIRKKSPKSSKYNTNSFRDPSGSVLIKNGQILRKVNFVYKNDYNFLIESGLYKVLICKNYLISHKTLMLAKNNPNIYKLLKPDIVPFISHPYEWCFGQLKDAALLTLKINKLCLRKGMILKDASAYNIQFLKGKPIFIDTLSFEKYNEGEPWVAYQQFCRHFLAPLLLASYKDYRLMQLLKTYIDGIPLDLTSGLLPLMSHLNFSVLSNIHLHSKTEKFMENKFVKNNTGRLSKNSLLAILDNLENLVTGLNLKIKKSEWQNYYQKNSYTENSTKNKKDIVKSFLKEVGSVDTLWDLGANTGYYSKDLVPTSTLVLNFDNDILAIEKNYEDVKKRGLMNILPLIMDLINPSPGLGWMNEERESLIQRGPSDVVLALALVHHLAISNNLPFTYIANFFSRICKWLIVEFVPKNDNQIKLMLTNRKDIFPFYNQMSFEEEFSKFFSIRKRINIKSSRRVLYLMRK